MLIFRPSSDINNNTETFLNKDIFESKYFLFQRYFSKRKNRLKITTRSTTYIYDKVRNDYFLHVRYGLKTSYTLNTGIISSLTKDLTKFPIKTTSFYQRHFKDLTIYLKHIIFRSNQDFRYRNITLKLKPLKDQIYLLRMPLLTKPLNKYIYFDLHNKIKSFSLHNPVFIFSKIWQPNYLKVYFLGFIFFFKNKRINQKLKIFKKSLKSPYRKRRKFRGKYYFKRKFYKKTKTFKQKLQRNRRRKVLVSPNHKKRKYKLKFIRKITLPVKYIPFYKIKIKKFIDKKSQIKSQIIYEKVKLTIKKPNLKFKKRKIK